MSNIIKFFIIIVIHLGLPVNAAQAVEPEVQHYLDNQRRSIALLGPGEWQLSLGLEAALQAREYGIGSGSLTQGTATIGISHGLTKGIEVFADLPVSYIRDSETFLGTTFTDTTWTGTGVRPCGWTGWVGSN